jgi:hypothetical protein
VWKAVGYRGVRKSGNEILDRRFRISANLFGVRAHQTAREDTARQAGNVVALERLERTNRELGGVGDLAESDAALLTQSLDPLAEVALRVQRSSC